ncbi:MAG: MBL fold metallo-hydrolase, partial [Atribacterota bacterium]|nr:MBL fold metallo-hydrolase [Atribacterota bacterium]
MVITASSGEVVMIDSGPDEYLILQKLRALNISHIDLLIDSHPHTDHITGMDTIIDTYQSRAFVDIGIPHTTIAYENLIYA